eukprot:CAMPEP_0185029392 /NCGR_PEP_ID=MMETSP1103-20130426/15671_1 /TAXON_ID=36769 /ORGANISM="Paraphysomonas bandaiensis, Strain Caron Lab Isolate" /LENGTH=986 /DNA_ID=CAMNT_0027564111 /DNA_START=302 /DNA_END=3262 /DNA_ORIENTATION=+
MKFGQARIRYAWVSQRGYYPDAPFKENQDCYTIIPQLEGVKDASFFAVYDGHGKEGHLCAQYVRDKLPMAIKDALCSQEALSNENIRDTLHTVHVATNQKLHDDRRVDDSLSGTTSISVLFLGSKMLVSNVGDSRCIIVSSEDGKLKAKPLSSDQTPYRKDERERVKKYGARVLSMDQIEGIEPVHENWGDINLGEELDEGGDPPRIWSPHGAYPGTAFTRSFGDMYAEELGVTAEPEILEREIQPNDRFVVIASDGVFEFLTNQMVADMVAVRPDPLEACRAIVAQAYELWLQYEVRTDDITIIALYIEGNESMKLSTKVSGASVGDIELSEEVTNRPVRRVISREKRKVMIQAAQHDTCGENGSDSRDIESLMHAHRIPKTEDEKSRLLLAISDNFLFHHLSENQRSALVDVVKRVPVKRGQWVITQGDQGDCLYIVDSGTYEVRVKTGGANDKEGGTVVHIYESGHNQHPCFGELSLMYGKPRAASVIANTDGMLWSLDRRIFTHAVLRTQDMRRNIIRSLRRVELLKCLNLVQLQRLVDLMSEEKFHAGDHIIRQGEEGEIFYVIVKGECKVLISSSDNPEGKEVARLGVNDYFGERALLNAEPRAASVIAVSDVEVLQVGKSGFEEVLGQLSAIIDADRQNKEKSTADRMNKAPRDFSGVTLNGVVSMDKFGSVALATYNSRNPNVCVKSSLLDAKEPVLLKHDVMNAYEAIRIIESASGSKVSTFVPKLLAAYRDKNAFHMLLDRPVVADLASLSNSEDWNISMVPYIAGGIVNALEAIHSLGIVYRSVQPEAVHLDINGKVVLLDYVISKIGGVGGRTFTICGVPDYLSPEQISQQGHNEAVDFWALGVLLYELATHENPFSASTSNEVAIFSSITSLGSPGNPGLTIDSSVPDGIADLIKKLVVPSPTSRLGVGADGLRALKAHDVFEGLSLTGDSPLRNFAVDAMESNVASGVSNDIVSKWTSAVVSGTEWLDELLE